MSSGPPLKRLKKNATVLDYFASSTRDRQPSSTQQNDDGIPEVKIGQYFGQFCLERNY